jgi:hypothetical protein
MKKHRYADYYEKLQDKHAYLRTGKLMATDPSLQFKLEDELKELEEEMNKLLTKHPELAQAYGQRSGLGVEAKFDRLLDYLKGLEVNPSSEIGPIHRVNCNRIKPIDLFWDSFLLDDDLNDYQVYLITACETQMPDQFAERLLLEYVIEEEPDYPNYRTNDKKRLLIETLPLKRNLAKSQQAFEAYIAERFDLKGNRDIDSFLGGEVVNYDFDFVLLAFQTLEEDWRDFIPEYYRWIIEQFQKLSTGGPKFLLTFVHYLHDVHREEQISAEHRDIVAAFDAIEREEKLAKHINRLLPVFSTDLATWFQRVGVTNAQRRDDLVKIVIDSLTPEARDRYEATGKIDMATIDLVQEVVYKQLTR